MLWNNMNLSLLIEFCINQEAILIASQLGCKILATTMAWLTPSLLPIPYVLSETCQQPGLGPQHYGE